jgi:hypothetical protein
MSSSFNVFNILTYPKQEQEQEQEQEQQSSSVVANKCVSRLSPSLQIPSSETMTIFT